MVKIILTVLTFHPSSVTAMFRLTDIINIAVQIEKNGEQSYREAAEKATDPEIKETLLWMAEEEKRHRKWFESIEDNRDVSSDHPDLEEMGKSLLQDMIANETFSLEKEQLNQAENLQELFAQAKNFEEDTALFYEFIKGLLDDIEASSKIDMIIAEERSHAEKLEEMVKQAGGEAVAQ